MLNRGFCFLLCAALLAALSACGAQEPAESPAASTGGSAAASEPSRPAQSSSLRELNMGAATSEGYYFIDPIQNSDGSVTLMYLDFAKGVELPLCSSPGCPHNGPECPANLPASGGGYVPLAVGEQLVLVYTGAPSSSQGLGEGALPRIETMEPDGSGRTPILRFESGQELFDPYITDGQNLYCNLMTTKGGQTTKELVCIDLTSGEMTALCTLDDSVGETLSGACGEAFILSSYNKQGQRVFLRMDAASLQKEELLTISPDISTYRLENGQLYYIAQNQLHALDCASLDDTVVCELDPLSEAQDALLGSSRDGHVLMLLDDYETGETSYFAIDTATGEQPPFTLAYSSAMGSQRPVVILAKVPGQEVYLVETGETMVDVQTTGSDGTAVTVQIPRPMHALISVSDYWSSNSNYTKIQSDF